MKSAVGRRRPLATTAQLSGHTTTQPSSIEEEGFLNLFDAGVHVATDLAVCETQHAVALTFEPALAFDIPSLDLRHPFVNTAIDLHHQPLRMAGEVREVTTDRRLSPEVGAKLPKLLPKALFASRHTTLKASRA
jgi:hypothetical protein